MSSAWAVAGSGAESGSATVMGVTLLVSLDAAGRDAARPGRCGRAYWPSQSSRRGRSISAISSISALPSVIEPELIATVIRPR